MSASSPYPIGTPGQPWQASERQAWREQRHIQREYQQEVVPKILALNSLFDVSTYGALSYDPTRYPLYVVKSRHWNANKPTVLITGGVHGYETSGVHGALQFLATAAEPYLAHFNLLAAPVSALGAMKPSIAGTQMLSILTALSFRIVLQKKRLY